MLELARGGESRYHISYELEVAGVGLSWMEYQYGVSAVVGPVIRSGRPLAQLQKLQGGITEAAQGDIGYQARGYMSRIDADKGELTLWVGRWYNQARMKPTCNWLELFINFEAKIA